MAGFFLGGGGSACIMPVNFTKELVLYMSAKAKASVKHVPLRNAHDRSLGVDDVAVGACNSGHARTALVHTAVPSGTISTAPDAAGISPTKAQENPTLILPSFQHTAITLAHYLSIP